MAKPICIFLFALAFFSLSEAATLNNFISSTFEPDQKVSSGALSASSSSYSLISADGTETFVFDNTAGAPVLDKGKLQQLLTEDLYARANYGGTLSSAKALQGAVLAAKDYGSEAGEDKCMQYTGTDVHECTDKESCVVACMANPLCETGILHADGSWEAILSWTNERKKFNVTLSSFNADLDSIKPGGASIDAKIALLDSLLLSASNISQNPLFLNRSDFGCANGTRRCLEYCPKIDYSMQLLTSMRASLASLKASLSPLGAQDARSAAILLRSTETQTYVDARAAKLSAFKDNMASELSSLRRDYSRLPAKNDMIGTRISSLANLSQNISAQGDAGFIHAALSRSKDFSDAASSIKADMGSLSASYASLKKSSDDLDDKIKKAGATLGNKTVGEYSLNLSMIEGKLAGKPDASSLPSMRAEVAALDSSLDKAIVQASLEGKTASAPAPTGGCALPIGMISLIALFAFAAKQN